MMLHGQLWGITAEGWVAIATFAGGLAVLLSGAAVILAARYAAKRFLGEQEARDVRRYLVDEGVWKLKDSLDRILQTIRLNFGQCMNLLRLVRDLSVRNADAPRLEDLPRLYPMDPQDFAFSAVRPASRILGSMELASVATSALARIYKTNAIFTNEVEQSVRTYYSDKSDLSDEQRREMFEHLVDLATRKMNSLHQFDHLAGWLEEAGRRVQEMRIARFDEVDLVQNDPKIVELREKIRALSEELNSLDEEG